jgi:chemotaxis protein MotB
MRYLMIVVVGVLSVACVTKGKYEAAVADGEKKLADANSATARELAAKKAAESALAACKESLGHSQEEVKNLSVKLNDAKAQASALEGQLAGCGKKMKDETGALSKALAETKAALEEARKAKAAAEARAAFFRELTMKFQKMIDSGELKIVLRNGRMVLQLATDILFDSGKTDLKDGGKTALSQVAHILATVDRQLQVAGHTDNVAIRSGKFPSNWELSTARAQTVLHYLVKEGVPPARLSAAGYGEFDPISPNDTNENKQKNRRIEITLQPDISEMIALPEAK